MQILCQKNAKFLVFRIFTVKSNLSKIALTSLTYSAYIYKKKAGLCELFPLIFIKKKAGLSSLLVPLIEAFALPITSEQATHSPRRYDYTLYIYAYAREHTSPIVLHIHTGEIPSYPEDILRCIALEVNLKVAKFQSAKTKRYKDAFMSACPVRSAGTSSLRSSQTPQAWACH